MCRKYSETHFNKSCFGLKKWMLEKVEISSIKEFQRFKFGLTLMKAKNNNIDTERI